ncbi:CDP-glycerol glycerophosphotransferase family protein [Methanobrevibacter sp.]|uniref:CDP-glycerol glycerophosphotransferase family protein n=1 Tax=Methanobrevibacter sp. TaxID=66852 RepID=UPI00388FF581
MVLRKIRNLKECLDNSSVYDAYYNGSIDENLIYFESRNGRDFTGNIFRIVEEISTGKYGDFKIHVYATPAVKNRIIEYEKNYNLKISKIITGKKEAAVSLEKAKYVFTDSGIQTKYVKRDGQVFVNTWHGTPLKLMGCDNASEITSLGHIQHSLLSADYLIYPNEYMADRMTNAYMIEKIYPGRVLFEGYPRNSIFFTKNHDLKAELDLEDKEIFVYMPTFRGILSDMDDVGQRDDVEGYMSQIDSKLTENQVLFAKLHAYNESQIDFSKFSHVKAFPKAYEIYEIVNLADVLITDYSSVFFDFANTSRKIVIFNYDEEEYLSYRGFYFPLSDLPFPKVRNVDELVSELNSPKEYDDGAFIQRFCTFDNPHAASNICRHIFKGDKLSREVSIQNDKPNVLIYGGPLEDTDSLIELLDSADFDSYNFFLTFNPWDDNIKNNYSAIFSKFPKGIEYLPFKSNLIPTFKEKLDYDKYFRKGSDMKMPDTLRKLFKRSFEKQYGSISFEFILDFYGLNPDVSLIFANSSQDKIIWQHTDPTGRINQNVLREIYDEFDLVVADSEELADKIASISNKDNLKVW